MEKMNESIYEQIKKDRDTYLANERVIGGLQVVYTLLDELCYYECSSIVQEVLNNLGSQIDTADTLLTVFNEDFKRQIDDKEINMKIKFTEEDLGEMFKR